MGATTGPPFFVPPARRDDSRGVGKLWRSWETRSKHTGIWIRARNSHERDNSGDFGRCSVPYDDLLWDDSENRMFESRLVRSESIRDRFDTQPEDLPMNSTIGKVKAVALVLVVTMATLTTPLFAQ